MRVTAAWLIAGLNAGLSVRVSAGLKVSLMVSLMVGLLVVLPGCSSESSRGGMVYGPLPELSGPAAGGGLPYSRVLAYPSLAWHWFAVYQGGQYRGADYRGWTMARREAHFDAYLDRLRATGSGWFTIGWPNPDLGSDSPAMREPLAWILRRVRAKGLRVAYLDTAVNTLAARKWDGTLQPAALHTNVSLQKGDPRRFVYAGGQDSRTRPADPMQVVCPNYRGPQFDLLLARLTDAVRFIQPDLVIFQPEYFSLYQLENACDWYEWPGLIAGCRRCRTNEAFKAGIRDFVRRLEAGVESARPGCPIVLYRSYNMPRWDLCDYPRTQAIPVYPADCAGRGVGYSPDLYVLSSEPPAGRSQRLATVSSQVPLAGTTPFVSNFVDPAKGTTVVPADEMRAILSALKGQGVSGIIFFPGPASTHESWIAGPAGDQARADDTVMMEHLRAAAQLFHPPPG